MSSPQLTYRIESITPQRAERLLDRNVTNRPIKRHHVTSLADQMLKGYWKVNGEAIKIDTNGNMPDGQHRCYAVIESGVTIQTLVVRGLEPEIFHTLDTGALRSKADTLAVAGGKNNLKTASALTLLEEFKTTGDVLGTNRKISNREVLDLRDKYATIDSSIQWGRKLQLWVPASVSIALHYCFTEINPVKADDFFARLHDGTDLKSSSPILLLRTRLLENASSKAKLSRRYIMALIIKSWNSYYHSRTTKNLRFREVGNAPEAFPVIG